MRQPLLLLLLFFGIVSCQKSTPVISNGPGSPPAPLLRTGLGSHYVYQIFEVDSNGQATPFGRPDTLTIAGDSVINGNTYVHLRDSWFNIGTRHLFFRDSSGYVVDQRGLVYWANRNMPDTITFQEPNSLVITYAFGRTNQTFALPAGKINGILFPARPMPAYEVQLHDYFTNGMHMSVCDSGLYLRRLFVPGIGLGIDQLTWSHSHYSHCSYLERRLVYYELNL